MTNAGWAVGFLVNGDDEFQVVRFKSYDDASNKLAGMLALASTGMEDNLACMAFLIELGDTPEEAFDVDDQQLCHLKLRNVMFVIGKFENFNHPDNEATFRVIQDHRDCTPDYCFGDIAERN